MRRSGRPRRRPHASPSGGRGGALTRRLTRGTRGRRGGRRCCRDSCIIGKITHRHGGCPIPHPFTRRRTTLNHRDRGISSFLDRSPILN